VTTAQAKRARLGSARAASFFACLELELIIPHAHARSM
jgi:hypothetical protein